MATDDYDFGFSFTSEEPTVTPVATSTASEDAINALQTKIDSLLDNQTRMLEDSLVAAIEEKYKAKLIEVEGLIMPLLVNLMKNPEKAYIKWENRTAIIQKQIDKITAITRGT